MQSYDCKGTANPLKTSVLFSRSSREQTRLPLLISGICIYLHQRANLTVSSFKYVPQNDEFLQERIIFSFQHLNIVLFSRERKKNQNIFVLSETAGTRQDKTRWDFEKKAKVYKICCTENKHMFVTMIIINNIYLFIFRCKTYSLYKNFMYSGTNKQTMDGWGIAQQTPSGWPKMMSDSSVGQAIVIWMT